MASGLLERLGNELAERHVEGEMKKAIDDGIAAGDDENAIVKRVYRGMFGPDSALVQASRAIPGFRILPHVVLTVAAEVLSRSADRFLPGDQRPMVRMVRLALKASAPALIGIGEAASDVIESQMNEAVDRTVSRSRTLPSDRNKLVDMIAVIENPLFGASHPFFPVARDDQGNVRMTTWGNPMVLDVTYQRFITDYETRNPHKEEKRGGGGKGQPQEWHKIPQTSPVTLYTVSEWASMVQTSGVQVEAAKLEELKKLFTPSTGEAWSPETWDVIRAYNASCADFERDGRFNWLDHEESEGLIATMKKANPRPTARTVHELLGVAYRDRIGKDGAPAGKLSFDTVVEIEQQAIDKWLGGEQPAYTKVVRAVRRIRRSATFRGVSWMQVAIPIAMASSVIWLPIAVCVALLVLALKWYLAGLLGADGTTLISNKAAAWLTIKSGVLALAVTWVFPAFQAATGWLKSLFPRASEDWLVDMGRKISAFGLVICTGVTTYAIMLNVPPDVRVIVPVSALVGIGVGIGLVAAGYRSQAEEIISKSAKPTLIVFGVIPLAIMFFWGSYIGNQTQSQTVVGGVVSYITDSKWLQLALMLGGLLVGSGLVSAFEYRTVPSGTQARLRIRGAGLLVAGIAAALALHVFFLDPAKTRVGDLDPWNSAVEKTDLTVTSGKSNVRVRETLYEDGSTHRSVSGRFVAAEASEPSKPKLKDICDEPLPLYQREQLGCNKPIKTSSLCDDKEISFHQRRELGCKD